MDSPGNATAARPALLRVKRRRSADAPDELLVLPGDNNNGRSKLARVDELSGAVESLLASSSRNPSDSNITIASESTALKVNESGGDGAQQPQDRKGALRFRRLDTLSATGVQPDTARALLARAMGVKRTPVKSRNTVETAETAEAARRKAAAAAAAQRADVILGRRRAVVTDAAVDPLRRYFRLFDVITLHTAAVKMHTGDGSTATEPVTEIGGVRLVRRHAGLRDARSAAARASFVPQTQLARGRILTPYQRRMDEAIWEAFRNGDFGPVFAALNDGSDVNFQRPQADLSTALMAAAYHGVERVVRSLLRRGALVRLANVTGDTALSLAASRQHDAVAALLRDMLTEEEDEIAAWTAERGDTAASSRRANADESTSGRTAGEGDRTDTDDFEYDVYVLDGGTTGAEQAESTDVAPGPRILRLDAQYHAPGLDAALRGATDGDDNYGGGSDDELVAEDNS